MDQLTVARCANVRLAPNAGRVITKPFLPREEIFPDGSTRMQLVLQRLVAIPDAEVVTNLAATQVAFSGRHRDLDSTFERNFTVVADHFDRHSLLSDGLSTDRRLLIGSYFTHEYSIEAAALGNPSIVVAPDQSGVAVGAVRFIMSLRAIGEGHLSSIEFRSGTVAADGTVTIEESSHYATHGTSIELSGGDGDYEVSFPPSTDISERVLFPHAPAESHGMEDARFVRFVDGTPNDGDQTYYATYTAFDGHAIVPHLLETADFRLFRATPMDGAAAQNKGIALFPRRINGQFAALGRHDNVNNYVMMSDDIRVWERAEIIQEPERPWELMQLGNCGSPLETEAGWLVITHGVGPMRTYSLGALLLDLDDPTRVIGHLKAPLLTAAAGEREGYVPNVVYSCGSMIHAGQLILPYGFADVGAGIATVPLADLLSRLTQS
jgi:predicted GH43/DUF377 family glycosyl hydrolase